MDSIHQLLDRASRLKVAVIGDLIQDQYIDGSVTRISPEAPVPVLLQKNTYSTLGGAGNVWQNLINLGVNAHLYCNCNYIFHESLQDNRIFINDYPHSVKIRMVCNGQQLLRVDREEFNAVEQLTFKHFSWWRDLLENFSSYDCIIFSDYGKGVCTESVINTVMEGANQFSVDVIVDTKGEFYRYKGADVIKCNNIEASGMVHEAKFVQELDITYLVITKGANGVSWYSADREDGVYGIPVDVVDSCGCGDTVTAILPLLKHYSIQDVIELANIAAAEVCKKRGVFPITKEILINAIPNVEHSRKRIE